MPDNDLQSLKQHPKILDLYRTRLSLKQDGRRWRGPCPFHNDQHATNFDIWQHEGTYIYKCLACGASGDIFRLLEKTDGIDFKTAVHVAREYCSEWSGERARVENVFKPVSQEKAVAKTYPEESYKAYEQALQNSPEAKSFLASRGITLEVAKRLRIGFRQDVGKLAGELGASVADRGWLSFPTFCTTAGAGAAGSNNQHSRAITSIKFRSIAGKFFCKMAGMAKIGEANLLFNAETVDFLEPVFLTEGELDVCALEQAGFRAVSVQNANHCPSPAEKDMLLSAEYCVLAGDNDGAKGKELMEKLFREMKERTFLLRWPEGVKDANQFLLEKCDANVSVFRTKINSLVDDAKSKPMTGVYDVRQSLLTTSHTSSFDAPNRLRFPWASVDDMAVILPGDVVTMYSTDSGMGKSTLALQASLFAAVKHGETVLNYQAEMTPQQIDTILTSHLLRKDRLTLGEEDYRLAGKSLPAGLKYYIGRDTSLTNIGQVLDLMEAAIRRFGASVVVLDNLHFLCRNSQDQVKEQSNASQRIKNIASSYGVKWINVHQARKADQNHKRKVTHISDMDGSKAIQNDSSVVFSIHREEIKHARDEESIGGHEYDPITEIRLQKVREKGPGKSYAQLLFVGNLSTFSEVARVEEPELFGGGQ